MHVKSFNIDRNSEESQVHYRLHVSELSNTAKNYEQRDTCVYVFQGNWERAMS